MSSAGHVGVVVAYDGSTITTQEGNVNGAEWARMTCSIEEFRAKYPTNLQFANPRNAPSFSGRSSSSGNAKYVVKVATWREISTSFETNIPGEAPYSFVQYEMTEQSINYYDMVKAYTMPFNYLWDLLTLSEDKDFVMDLADLVYNSEIVITINDNLTTTKDITVRSYTENTNMTSRVRGLKEDGSVYMKHANGNTEQNYSSTKIVVTQTNTLDVALTKANVWIVDYNKNYKYEKGQTTIGGSGVTPVNVDPIPDREDQNDPLGVLSAANSECKEITSFITKYRTSVESSQDNTTITDTIKYVSDVAELREKTEKVTLKKSEIGPDKFKYKEKNFVTLLVSNQKAKRNILNAASWLFEMLEIEENDLADMVDLTKYLLYKATGTDYGITEFDFSIFDPANFTSVDGIMGNTTEEKVWYALRSAGYSAEATAGVMGNIYAESGFRLDAEEQGPPYQGRGLIQWSYGRREQLFAYAQSKGKEWKDAEIQIEFLLGELSESGGADGFAGCGFMTYNGYSRNGWINASDPETAAVEFMGSFERPLNIGADARAKRGGKAREYYNQFKDRPLESFTGGKIGNVESSPNYCQWQGTWAQMRFGGHTVANTGCGPTTAAIAITALTGKQVTPDQTCQYAYSKGLYNTRGMYGCGSAAIEACARNWGLNAKSTNSVDEVEKALKDGKAVAAPLVGTVFYSGSHYVCLLGYQNGNTFVRDPNHPSAPGSQWHNLRNYIWPHKDFSFTIIG